jgi:hypothetical protein
MRADLQLQLPRQFSRGSGGLRMQMIRIATAAAIPLLLLRLRFHVSNDKSWSTASLALLRHPHPLAPWLLFLSQQRQVPHPQASTWRALLHAASTAGHFRSSIHLRSHLLLFADLMATTLTLLPVRGIASVHMPHQSNRADAS